MSDIIELYNSKFIQEKTVGNNNFFNNSTEIVETDKLQQKYISSVDFSKPENFAKFGSAEEYYNNCIKYISEYYPYDLSTSRKLEWVNSLNDLEYYIFSKEFPRSYGFIDLSGSQFLEIKSHVKTPEEADALSIYSKGSYLTNNTVLDFKEGLTFEGWFNFHDSQDSNILSINGIDEETSGVFSDIILLKIKKENLDANNVKISILNGTETQKYTFLTPLEKNTWIHCSFFIKDGLAKLYINGSFKEIIDNLDIDLLKFKYMFFPLGLMLLKLTNTEPYEGEFDRSSVFKMGGGGKVSFDDVRLWNGERSIEKIGRYWFTNVDGNDPFDINNDNLLFYYKFNEGWDSSYRFLCLDSSGRKNDAEIKNYLNSCAQNGSGILSSSHKTAFEEPSIIYEGLQYSDHVKNYYNEKISVGREYDLQNDHMLYKKFPGWILEDEQENNTKHLKQIIQVICSYYDDLFNKIKEITNYKDINFENDYHKIYPFYDKILTSMGFDVGTLFNDVSFIEAISSRNDTHIFEEKISKVKNLIYKNIYNNLSYILKSKGTYKSLNSFINSYGLNDNIIKINIYGNNSESEIDTRTNQKFYRKKTLSLIDDNLIKSETFTQPDQLTVEANFLIDTLQYSTSSICGIYSGDNKYYATFEKINDSSFKVVLNSSDGITNTKISSDAYFYNMNKEDTWTACFRKKNKADIPVGLDGAGEYLIELYILNNSVDNPISIKISSDFITSNTFSYYIGSSTEESISTCFKFINCNYWDDSLADEVIIIHNKDIFNYGNI